MENFESSLTPKELEQNRVPTENVSLKIQKKELKNKLRKYKEYLRLKP